MVIRWLKLENFVTIVQNQHKFPWACIHFYPGNLSAFMDYCRGLVVGHYSPSHKKSRSYSTSYHIFHFSALYIKISVLFDKLSVLFVESFSLVYWNFILVINYTPNDSLNSRETTYPWGCLKFRIRWLLSGEFLESCHSFAAIVSVFSVFIMPFKVISQHGRWMQSTYLQAYRNSQATNRMYSSMLIRRIYKTCDIFADIACVISVSS